MLALVTNDDGIHAPGLDALVAALRGVATRVIVVAPRDPHSGCGHRVTTDRPLVIEPAGTDRYSVDGTPADCVRLALVTLLRGPGEPAGGRPAGSPGPRRSVTSASRTQSAGVPSTL